MIIVAYVEDQISQLRTFDDGLTGDNWADAETFIHNTFLPPEEQDDDDDEVPSLERVIWLRHGQAMEGIEPDVVELRYNWDQCTLETYTFLVRDNQEQGIPH